MKGASPSADRSPEASPSNVSTPAVGGSTAGPSRPSSSHEIQTEPRYIRLPDALYALRRRYPSVTESIFLECTRCHQWVAVPVLREIPNEIASAVVSRSALGLDPISVRTGCRGPLRHTYQDTLRRREELANDTAAPQWRSRRLQEKQSHLVNGDTNHSDTAHEDVDRAATATPKQNFFESILQHLRRNRCTSQDGAEGSALAASQSARQTSQRHTPLYIPNPDTFICAGWQCAWDADALADLRRDWLQSIYRAVPMPTVSEERMTLSPGASSPSPSLESCSDVSFVEVLRQRQAALNEALALELDVGRSRRLGRGAGQLAGSAKRKLESQDSLPALSLPANAAENTMELSRMQGSWVRAAALHLLRNNGSGAEGRSVTSAVGDNEADALQRRNFSAEEESQENVLSAYCWAMCDACGKLRRVAQPFPGGAPFVCAMAVTTSSSCRAARSRITLHHEGASGLDQACTVSEVEGLMQCNIKLCEAELIYAALSSPFLPYPLRAQLSSLSRRQACFKDPQESAEQLSRADVSRILLSEPLLRTIQSSVRESVAKGSTSPTVCQRRRGANAAVTPDSVKSRRKASASELDDSDTDLAEREFFIYRSLPILRELARSIKARSISAFVRQLQLTPAQIQAKREAVMLASFLSNHQQKSTIGSGSGTEKQKPAAVIATASDAETTRVKVEEGEPPSTDAGERLPPRLTRTRTGALPTVSKAAPALAAVKEPMKMQAASSNNTVTPRPVVEPVPARTRRKASHDAAPSAAKRQQRQQRLAYEAAEQKPQQAGLATSRKRGRPPRHGSEEPSRPVVPQYQSTTETTTVVSDVDTASVHHRRQRCDNLPMKEETAEKSSAAAVQKAEPVGGVESSPASRPRGRPPRSGSGGRKHSQGTHNAASEGKAANGTKWEVVHWVQCDLCSKWRIVPQRIPVKVKFWECKMRYDKQRGRATTCDDPDDEELAS